MCWKKLWKKGENEVTLGNSNPIIKNLVAADAFNSEESRICFLVRS